MFGDDDDVYDDGYGDDEWPEMEHEGISAEEAWERMNAAASDDDGEDDPHVGDGVHEALCAICCTELTEDVDWDSCDRCAGPVCRECSVPAVDKHGNLVILCAVCVAEKQWSPD
jgi:hypothetical protein